MVRLAMILATLVLMACSTASPPAPPSTAAASTGKYTVRSSSLDSTSGAAWNRIVGEVKNTSPSKATIKIVATLYDASGKVVGTADDVQNDVAAGDTVPFSIMVLKTTAFDHYRLQARDLY